MKKVKETKRGVSLITLVITIIIIAIMAMVVILNISDFNIIEQANLAVARNNVFTYINELSIYLSSKMSSEINSYNIESLYANNEYVMENDLKDTNRNIKHVLTSISDEDINKFEIQKGRLLYSGNSEKEYDKIQDIVDTVNFRVSILNNTSEDFGSVTIDKSFVKANEVIVVSAVANEGYKLDEISATNATVEDNMVTVLGTGNVVITVTFTTAFKDNELTDASDVVFNSSKYNSYEIFTAPQTGVYKVELYGGAGAGKNYGFTKHSNGAYIVGNINLKAGQQIAVVAGSKGKNGEIPGKTSYYGKGGYSSFIAKTDAVDLGIDSYYRREYTIAEAGGGGGAGGAHLVPSGGNAGYSNPNASGVMNGSNGYEKDHSGGYGGSISTANIIMSGTGYGNGYGGAGYYNGATSKGIYSSTSLGASGGGASYIGGLLKSKYSANGGTDGKVVISLYK